MKYYVYISDAKLDMLFPQIPSSVLKRITGELDIDLKVVSVSLKQQPSEETRYSKLRVVEDFIKRSDDVGTVEDPKSYFSGTLPLRWGTTGFGTWYYGGFTKDTILGLAGSEHHAMNQGRAEPFPSFSSAPHILHSIQSYVTALYENGDDPSAVPEGEAILSHPLAHEGDHEALEDFIVPFTTRLPGPQQRVEFLARKLITRPIRQLSDAEEYARREGRWWIPGDYRRVLLGTPIYVALADDGS